MNAVFPKLILFLPIVISVASNTAKAQRYDLLDLNDSVSIYAVDARPVSAGLQLISAEYAFEMTYEDPQILAEDDIDDVTLQYRSDLHLFDNPSEAPRILVPRLRTLRVSVPFSKESATRNDWLRAIGALVDANTLATGAQFRVEQFGDTVHVIPRTAKDESGRLVAQSLILDTSITIPAQEMTGLAMVTAFCEAVSVAAGGTFSLDPDTSLESLLKPMRVPIGKLGDSRVVLEADDEPARDVILRTLRAIDDGVAWQVFVTFEPRYKNYWINIRSLTREEQVVPDEVPPAPRHDEEEGQGFFLGSEAQGLQSN